MDNITRDFSVIVYFVGGDNVILSYEFGNIAIDKVTVAGIERLADVMVEHGDIFDVHLVRYLSSAFSVVDEVKYK